MKTDCSRHSKAHTVYKLKDGTKVPSVTTCLKVLDKSNFLVPWANKLGMEGIDSSKYRDEKAIIGRLAHEMIMAHWKKEEPDLYDYSQRDIDGAENCYLKALEWEKRHTIKPILVEKEFVSDLGKFGGTIDLYAEIDDCLDVVDYKTGAGLYPEMWYQIAGYCLLLQEHGYQIDGRRLLNIGRDDTENFVEASRKGFALDDELLIFNACKAIYGAKRRLKND